MIRNQYDRVYRLLNGLVSPLPGPTIARTLEIPYPSVRRILSDLRVLQVVESTPLGFRLSR